MSSKKTVLLVDDEESILFSLQRVLELSGEYEVVIAENGKKAREKLEGFIPDLILSDIVMPEMDGIELCNKIRENELTKNIPFIFLTARKELMIEGIKAGGDDFIIKPFTIDEVLVKMEAIFRRVKSTKEQVSQVKGTLSDGGLDTVLKLCFEKSISGELVLQKKDQFGKVFLDRGEVIKVEFNDLAEDEALDALRSWNSGIFIVRPTGVRLRPQLMPFKSKKEEMENIDEPVELAENTWWVGRRNKKSMLQLNVYLRKFQKDKKVINFLIDPGSPVDFPIVSKKISRIIGDMSNIHLYSLSHQDPDVCMAAVFIHNANKRAICMTTEENWRLISHYEINPRSVKIINNFRDWRVTLSTAHKVIFIPSPFCHAKGAFMTYDLQTRILFTGDLFGGISEAGRIRSLFAEEQDWDGIRAFHQIYMPSNNALRYAVDQIKKLDPPPLMIAPQHGNILHGEIMEQFLNRVYNLDVGSDLLESEGSDEKLKDFEEAANELLELSGAYIPREQIEHRMRENPQILPLCDFKNCSVTKIFSKPQLVFEQIAMSLIKDESARVINIIKTHALKIAQSKGLPAPLLDRDKDETLTGVPKKLFETEE